MSASSATRCGRDSCDGQRSTDSQSGGEGRSFAGEAHSSSLGRGSMPRGTCNECIEVWLAAGGFARSLQREREGRLSLCNFNLVILFCIIYLKSIVFSIFIFRNQGSYLFFVGRFLFQFFFHYVSTIIRT